MTWNRAKSFEVFGMACSGLGSFRFASVVPGDFAIQITFQAFCSTAKLLSFSRVIHMTWKVVCMASVAYSLHGTKNFEVFGMAVQRTWKVFCMTIGNSYFYVQITFQVRCTQFFLLPSPLYETVFLLGKYFVCDEKNQFLYLALFVVILAF
jgi:hypothetical protein